MENETGLQRAESLKTTFPSFLSFARGESFAISFSSLPMVGCARSPSCLHLKTWSGLAQPHLKYTLSLCRPSLQLYAGTGSRNDGGTALRCNPIPGTSRDRVTRSEPGYATWQGERRKRVNKNGTTLFFYFVCCASWLKVLWITFCGHVFFYFNLYFPKLHLYFLLDLYRSKIALHSPWDPNVARKHDVNSCRKFQGNIYVSKCEDVS